MRYALAIGLLLGLSITPARAHETRAIGFDWLLSQWTVADGLPSNNLNSLAMGADGRLWIATWHGLTSFDGATFAPLGVGTPTGTLSPRVVAVARQPGSSALWLWLEGSRLERLDASGRRDFGTFKSTLWMAEGAKALWLYAEDALWSLEDEPRRVATLPLDFPFGALAEADDGTLWLQRADDARWFPLDAQRRPRAEGAVADADFTGWRRGPWLAHGSAVLRDGAPLLSVSEVRGQVVDGDTLWLATAEEGLLQIRPRPVEVVLPPADLNPRVERLRWDPDEQQLWARSSGGAWWSVTDPSRRLDLPALHDLSPTDLARVDVSLPLSLDGVGRGWATHGGVFREDPETQALRRDADGPAFWMPLETWTGPDGSVWLGTDNGLFVYAAGRWTALRAEDQQALDLPRSFVTLPDGSTGVGCRGGLAWVDPRRARVRPPRAPAPVSVRHVRRDGDTLWLATEERGLCAVPVAAAPDRLAEPAAWRCVTQANGLGTYGVHASLEDGRGRTWVSANTGIGWAETAALRRFAAGRAQEVPFLWLGAEDGLRSTEANGTAGGAAWASADGDLWFPTQQGVARVHPDRVAAPRAPIARLTAVEVNGARQEDLRAVTLLAPDDSLLVSWAAASLDRAAEVVYRQRLDEGAWSEPDPRSSVLLRHLEAGPHRLEVQAGVAGRWGPGVSLALSRAPTLWERPAAWAALALGLFGLVIAVFTLRIRAGRAREVELGRRVRDATQQLSSNALLLEVQNTTLTEKSAMVERQNLRLRSAADELRGLYEQTAAQAERLAAADRMQRALLVNVSHELRTPLSLILGPLDLARDDVPPGPARQAIDLALHNADRLNRLVGQLLDVARAQGGVLPFRARSVRIGRLIASLLQRFPGAAAGAGDPLKLPDPDPLVWCDPEMVDTMLGNLVANAREHGDGRVEVSVLVETGEGGQAPLVRVVVRDHGHGVPPGAEEAIFARFNVRDGGAPRRGLGLGLALVRELAHLQGGDVGVRSPPEGGAAFWFTLPLGVAHIGLEEVDLSQTPDPPDAPAAPATGPGEAPTLLLVEDNEALRAFLQPQLAARYRVVDVPDAEAAMARLEEGAVDLLVSDVMLPGQSGIALAAWARAREGLVGAVLLISARGEVGDRVEGLGVADDYLPKPFQVRELVARCEALLRRTARLGDAAVDDAPDAAAHLPESDARFLGALEAAADACLSDDQLDLDKLARMLAMSRRTLHDRMRELGLESPGTWLRERRMARAEELIARGTYETVGEVAAAVGLSRAYFTRAYKARTGTSPGNRLKERFEQL